VLPVNFFNRSLIGDAVCEAQSPDLRKILRCRCQETGKRGQPGCSNGAAANNVYVGFAPRFNIPFLSPSSPEMAERSSETVSSAGGIFVMSGPIAAAGLRILRVRRGFAKMRFICQLFLLFFEEIAVRQGPQNSTRTHFLIHRQ
jgi:hypothetical protein